MGLFSHGMAGHMFPIDGQLQLQPVLKAFWCEGAGEGVGSFTHKPAHGRELPTVTSVVLGWEEAL